MLDRIPPLTRPLVDLAWQPSEVPSEPAVDRVLALDGQVRQALREGRDADALTTMTALRFESYREASIRWENRFWLGRVCTVEELQSELHRRSGQIEAAWATWRAGWWVRRLLADSGHPEALREATWADGILACWHLARGRADDAKARLDEALPVWEVRGLDPRTGAELRQLDRELLPAS